MLERGGAPGTVRRLKDAAALAQQEARFAILALSSASGNAPFDAALRRYLDVLTADGELEVELEVDPGIQLAPDEQIEVFRIVQEGLANVRKHAGAAQAEVWIGRDGTRRLVRIRDDGAGFEPNGNGAGQGLKNMKIRATSIGGLELASIPGQGTALESSSAPSSKIRAGPADQAVDEDARGDDARGADQQSRRARRSRARRRPSSSPTRASCSWTWPPSA